MNQTRKIAVIGNPNCGKTTLFNQLTGAKQTVGNWPGVTVEKKSGTCELANHQIEVIDLPGTYTLDIFDAKTSIDEIIAREYILSCDADVFVNIIDASNLERNLYLTSQLLEMQLPMIIVVNMIDVAERSGIKIDFDQLSSELGCPVVGVVASSGEGVENFKSILNDFVTNPTTPKSIPTYGQHVEQAISQLEKFYQGSGSMPSAVRWKAIKLLELDESTMACSPDNAQELAKELHQNVQVDGLLDLHLTEQRYQFAKNLVEASVERKKAASASMTQKIDDIILNKYLGIPIFLGIMYIMFLIAINIGSAFIEFFDLSTGALIVDGSRLLLQSISSPEWLTLLISDGLGGGIQLVATFIPVIGFLYLCLAFIEDSGYMARAAFIMDRLMRAIGLPGKAFVPLIVGFGCNVPSVMASRTLESHKDRLLTMAMAPFMSCGARLSVYALFVAAFFTENGANIVFGLYIIGILMAVLTGLALKHTLFEPTLSPFIMELPAYHLPTFRAIIFKTWDRLKSFFVRAGKTIIIVFVVLKLMSSIGIDGSFGNDNTQKSILSQVSKSITPIFNPIGVDDANWPATVGIFTGVFAKEAVVGTLDALYVNLAAPEQSAEAIDINMDSIENKLLESVQSVPKNLADVFDNLLDPLGLSAANVSDRESAAIDQEVQVSTYVTMSNLFSSEIAAFSYLLFILLYSPCVAVMGALYREAGMRWMLFVVSWSTGLAYMTASVFYQTSLIGTKPVQAVSWIFGCILVSAVAIGFMRRYGKKLQKQNQQIPILNVV
jgi:ferrous iron transport protein B